MHFWVVWDENELVYALFLLFKSLFFRLYTLLYIREINPKWGKKEENIDDQTSQRGVLKAMFFEDKSSLIAIEKRCYWKLKVMLLQSRRIDLLWERLWALKISRMRCLCNGRAKVEEGTEKGSEVEGTNSRTLLTMLKCWDEKMMSWIQNEDQLACEGGQVDCRRSTMRLTWQSKRR